MEVYTVRVLRVNLAPTQDFAYDLCLSLPTFSPLYQPLVRSVACLQLWMFQGPQTLYTVFRKKHPLFHCSTNFNIKQIFIHKHN